MEMNDLEKSNESKKRPICHMTPMSYEFADDGFYQVDFWECKHCGHTKEIGRDPIP